jgi:hypothetical protein
MAHTLTVTGPVQRPCGLSAMAFTMTGLSAGQAHQDGVHHVQHVSVHAVPHFVHAIFDDMTAMSHAHMPDEDPDDGADSAGQTASNALFSAMHPLRVRLQARTSVVRPAVLLCCSTGAGVLCRSMGHLPATASAVSTSSQPSSFARLEELEHSAEQALRGVVERVGPHVQRKYAHLFEPDVRAQPGMIMPRWHSEPHDALGLPFAKLQRHFEPHAHGGAGRHAGHFMHGTHMHAQPGVRKPDAGLRAMAVLILSVAAAIWAGLLVWIGWCCVTLLLRLLRRLLRRTGDGVDGDTARKGGKRCEGGPYKQVATCKGTAVSRCMSAGGESVESPLLAALDVESDGDASPLASSVYLKA